MLVKMPAMTAVVTAATTKATTAAATGRCALACTAILRVPRTMHYIARLNSREEKKTAW